MHHDLSHDSRMSRARSQKLMMEQDVAEMLNVTVSAVRRWRVENRGPEYLKVGSLVRYRPTDVKKWLSSLARSATPVSQKLKK